MEEWAHGPGDAASAKRGELCSHACVRACVRASGRKACAWRESSGAWVEGSTPLKRRMWSAPSTADMDTSTDGPRPALPATTWATEARGRVTGTLLAEVDGSEGADVGNCVGSTGQAEAEGEPCRRRSTAAVPEAPMARRRSGPPPAGSGRATSWTASIASGNAAEGETSSDSSVHRCRASTSYVSRRPGRATCDIQVQVEQSTERRNLGAHSSRVAAYHEVTRSESVERGHHGASHGRRARNPAQDHPQVLWRSFRAYEDRLRRWC